VTNADESFRQHVKQESPDEFVSRNSHRSHLVAAGVMAPTEGHAVSIKRHEPVIGDRNTVGIAAEVADDLFGAAKSGLGINNPIVTKQRSKECCEAFWGSQVLDRSGAGQQFLAMSPPGARRRTFHAIPGFVDLRRSLFNKMLRSPVHDGVELNRHQ